MVGRGVCKFFIINWSSSYHQIYHDMYNLGILFCPITMSIKDYVAFVLGMGDFNQCIFVKTFD